MENFSVCTLSSAGTVTPLEGEYTTATIGKVTLQTHTKQTTPHINGSVVVTTHRIVWLDSTRKRGISAGLWQVGSPGTEDKSSPLHARVLVRLGRGVRVLFESGTPFRDRDRFVGAVRAATAAREWVKVAERQRREAEKKAREGEYVRRRVGAAGVVDRVTARNVATGSTIEGGFASIEKLRTQAEELIGIARNFAWKEGEKDGELVNMLAEMGMASPVTRASAGSVRMYREELARQMGEFLRGRVAGVGGLMTLSDAYCVVIRNRASTELVSPEDFRGACGLFAGLRLGVGLVKLESGVWAVCADAGGVGARGLREWVRERGCVTDVDVVRERRIPLQRARIMLEDAERQGLLCRDQAVGVRFYDNEFDRFIR